MSEICNNCHRPKDSGNDAIEVCDCPTGSELASARLLARLNDCLRNAHYWMTERSAPEQAEGAILEARGICMELSEAHYGTNLSMKPKAG